MWYVPISKEHTKLGQNEIKKRKAILFILLLLSCFTAFPFKSAQAQDPWYDTNWGFRISHTIRQTLETETNYDVLVNVFYGNITRFFDVSQRWTTISGNPTDRHTFQPVHDSKIQVVNLPLDGSVRKYLAYDSNEVGSEIRLYYTNDTTGLWYQFSGNPILGPTANEYRWPSTTWNGTHLNMFLCARTKTNIERWTSTDGENFTYQETVIDTASSGESTANSFIYLDPIGGWWHLYWHNASGANRYIHVRSASALEDLDSATDIQLAVKTISFGAAAMFYHDGKYFLLAEQDDASNVGWETIAYQGTSANGTFTECVNSPFLSQDEACATIFLTDDESKVLLFSNRDSVNWYQDTRYVYLNASIALDSKCKTDFGDILFTDDDGQTLLDYYMVEKTDGEYARFYVEVTDNITDAAQTIYLYYNNSGASTTSNGANTFRFFDDFSSSIDWSSKWQSTDQSHYSIEDGKLIVGLPTETMEMIQTNQSYSSIMIEISSRNNLTTSGGYLELTDAVATYRGSDNILLDWQGGQYYLTLGGVARTLNEEDLTNYHTKRYYLPSVGNALSEVWKSDGMVIAYERSPQYTTIYPSFFTFAAPHLLVDYIFIRNYTNPEPLRSWGSEEEQGVTGFSSKINKISNVFSINGIKTINISYINDVP